jgi:hypothetical protein
MAAKPKPVIVTWRDAWYNAEKRGTLDGATQAASETCIRTQVGFLLEQTEDHVAFVTGFIEWRLDGDRTIDGLHHIPAAMVISIKRLK